MEPLQTGNQNRVEEICSFRRPICQRASLAPFIYFPLALCPTGVPTVLSGASTGPNWSQKKAQKMIQRASQRLKLAPWKLLCTLWTLRCGIHSPNRPQIAILKPKRGPHFQAPLALCTGNGNPNAKAQIKAPPEVAPLSKWAQWVLWRPFWAGQKRARRARLSGLQEASKRPSGIVDDCARRALGEKWAEKWTASCCSCCISRRRRREWRI